MEPMINRELEKVDERISNVEELKFKLMDAFSQFHEIVSRTSQPNHGYYNTQKLPSQPPMGTMYAQAAYQVCIYVHPNPFLSTFYYV